MTAPRRVPITATYRVQFNARMTFRDAEALVPYLAALGVSHLYASPYLKARAGSTHGYDITDYNALNPEIGEAADLELLIEALQRHGLGQILDFVPNHMGVGKADNDWWLDVLEWGPASPYAEYFDIEWAPAKEDLRGKVLLPFLGDHYGRVLENGELQVAFDRARARFSVVYHEHAFPIRPPHYGDILTPHLERLRQAGDPRQDVIAAAEAIAATVEGFRISRQPVERRRATRDAGERFKRDLAARLANDSALAQLIDEAVQAINGSKGDPASFVPLHRLLERQSYRLAYWRVASHEINYRRFFDVNDLAGVRMENAALFEDAHRFVLGLARDGKIDGLRIDHVDGMRDPAQYLRRLSRSLTTTASDEAGGVPYIIVEKILARHESLRRTWPIDGTTGYDVLNLLNGVFVRPEAEAPLSEIYDRFVGGRADFDSLLYDCKRLIIETILASELEVLANELDKLSESHWSTRDFTLVGLREALAEVAAGFPVYRTYVDTRGVTADDRRDIDWAISQARKRATRQDASVFDFIHAVLTADLVKARASGYSRPAVTRFAMHFQQFTGPVMAKSLEDTSFYRFNRLLSLNEVGSDPRRFGTSIAAFHHQVAERARHWPRDMSATATHDTKRGEDARTRLDVLSEMPEEWAGRVARWATFNRRFKAGPELVLSPTANDEYLLYQMLLGSWPNELMRADALDEADRSAFQQRVETCYLKALREAKATTSWSQPNAVYEEAALAFARDVLDPQRSPQFLADFIEFAGRIAWFGMLNSLSQTVLKLTMPGVPDIYQGTEVWDYSMVDPDNRRPVDFAARLALLQRLQGVRGSESRGRRWFTESEIDELVAQWPDGRLKLLTVSRLLQTRRARPRLFVGGGYHPLSVEGARADHLCAFARDDGDSLLVVVVPRFFVALCEDRLALPAAASWGDTIVLAPPMMNGRPLVDLFTGRTIATAGRAGLSAADVLGPLPFAVLATEGAFAYETPIAE